jgi:hypothetical protein
MNARLSSADTAWLHMDRPTNLMVINTVFLFDEPVDWDRVKGDHPATHGRSLPALSPAGGRESRAAARGQVAG